MKITVVGVVLITVVIVALVIVAQSLGRGQSGTEGADNDQAN